MSGLQSRNFAFADSGTTFLKFRAAPATIAQLTGSPWQAVAGNAWQDADLNNFRHADAPLWWTPAKTQTAQMFVARNHFGSFAGENEVLIFDPANGQTYYAFVGID